MKKSAIILLFLVSIHVWSNSFYELESQGYFKNSQFLNDGIICSDNYDSALYLIQNQTARKLLAAPGAGRFFTTNERKTKIGFKWIDSETGLQRPAIYDLTQNKITYLAEKQTRCSQVYFHENSIYYILDKKLNILSENELQEYQLPDFSNLMAISPDGNIIALRNEKEQIFLFHLSENRYSIITPNGESYLPISWSNDGNYLLIKDIGEGLYLYHFDKKAIIDLEIKGFAEWYDSSHLLISQKEWSKETLKTTLFLYNIASGAYEKIRNSDTFIILDFFIESNSLVFTSLEDKSIYKGKLIKGDLTSVEKMFQLNDNLENIKLMKTQRSTSKNLSIPYINQMYDTPQGYGHNYGACAAATATMAIMFCKILPHWDTTNASPYSHVTHWGNYIGGTIYTYRGVVYNQAVYYESGAGWCYNGIDNYHWYNGSPNSKMKNLLQNHGLTSSQHWTSSCTYSMISGQIADDYPYPLCVTMTSSGHLILAKGFYNDSQKLLYYHDPYGNKNTYPYLGYDGNDVVYDWPGENNGYASLVSVAWSVSAQATHQPEPELEIDVLQLAYGANHEDYSVENPGFFLSTTGTLGMRYWRSEIGGNNEIYWWTGAIGGFTDDYFATWRPNIIHSGSYEVEVFIPTESTVTSNAIYKIYHADGMEEVSVNQAANGGSWVSLGEFTFSNDNSCYLYLGDAVGAKSIGNDKQNEERLDKILYDTARFTFIESDSPYIYQSDFENNNGGLTTNLDWEWGEDTLCGANSGTKVWGTVLNGNYHDRADVYLDLTVETGENSELSFYHWHQIEDVYRDVVFDGGNIKISADGGVNFEILYPEEGYPHTMRYSMYNPLSYEPCFSGETEGWELVECNLNTYPNQEVIIRWHFGSDGATMDRGWYLDDIKVEEIPLQLEVPNVSFVTLANTLQLTWNEIENASIYRIYFCTEPNGMYSLLHETSNTFFAIDENENIGFYYVKAATEVERKEIIK